MEIEDKEARISISLNNTLNSFFKYDGCIANDIDGCYENLMRLLASDEEKNPENRDFIQEKRKIIERFYKLMKDPTVISDIKNKRILKKDFLSKYANLILGKDLRKYDMSDLYNSSLIASNKRIPSMKNIKANLRRDNRVTHRFTDNNGNNFSITKIGELNYQEFTGLDTGISIYEIEQSSKGDETLAKRIIYSNINIQQMDDEEYRNLVLHELLGTDNLDKSNCGGYVGEILRRPRKNEQDTLFSESRNSSEYTYRLTDKYVLSFDATAVTASMDMPVNTLQTSIQEKTNEDNRVL